jgi:hypothetical protein
VWVEVRKVMCWGELREAASFDVLTRTRVFERKLGEVVIGIIWLLVDG